eukprot:TRINITY_DN2361_c0_g1_i1.p2 TRINITY_DN2361_c0_g1~~TRINITY_DN2361_c0_g1_i1.p2  ORF type:complete len:136 (-),score=32.51 TRINITY_DN2361_c0_g1_i1:155-562(-)
MGDLQQVSGLARQMVINYGFSSIGPWTLMDPSAQSGDVVMRMMARGSVSESVLQKIDEEVKKLSDEAYQIALDHIQSNREAIDKIVDELVEVETMDGDRFRELLGSFTTIPEENIQAALATKSGQLAGAAFVKEE